MMSIFNGIERDAINQITKYCECNFNDLKGSVYRIERELSEITPYYELHSETQRIFMEKIIERVEAIEKKMVDLEFNHKLVSALVDLIKK